MRPRTWLIAGVLGVVALGPVLILTLRSKPAPESIRIATGTPGGTYWPVGERLESLLEDAIEVEVEAKETSGSVDNIDWILRNGDPAAVGPAARNEVDGETIGLVMRPALVDRSGVERDELRALARLYADVVHVLVRKNDIHDLGDLKGRKVYLGKDGSATQLVASKILESVIGAPTDTPDASFVEQRGRTRGFGDIWHDLSTREGDGFKLDAAFIVAGMPVTAVQQALDHAHSDVECKAPDCAGRTLTLLDLHAERDGLAAIPRYDLEPVTIPAYYYRNQDIGVETVGADVYLVCHAQLDAEVASTILETIFDNLRELLSTHTTAQDIRVTEAFRDWETGDPTLPPLHSGAVRFSKRERGKLLIATGTLNGKYYEIGRKIQFAVEQYGVDARVIQTDGSIENARLLAAPDDRRIIAIMQSDVAVATQQGSTEYVYSMDDDADHRFPKAPLRRLATLHDERLHIIARAEVATSRDLFSILKDPSRTFCIGPEGSGTQLVVRAMFRHHGGPLEEPLPHLPVSDMVARLHAGDIDVGFYMSHLPSAPLLGILDDDRFALLPIDRESRRMLLGSHFEYDQIPAGVYASLPSGEPPVDTIRTRAVLVTTKDMPDVDVVTRAIFEAAPFDAISAEVKNIQRWLERPVPHLKDHPDAVAVYQDLGLRVSPPPPITLPAAGQLLGILVVLLAGYKGLLEYKRDRVANELGRRLLGVPLEAEAPDSVHDLFALRHEIHDRVRRRWWRLGELDRRRWRYLDELIDGRVGVARDNQLRSFMAEILEVMHDHGVAGESRSERLRAIERRVWQAFGRGEIDDGQKAMLRDIIGEAVSNTEHGS